MSSASPEPADAAPVDPVVGGDTRSPVPLPPAATAVARERLRSRNGSGDPGSDWDRPVWAEPTAEEGGVPATRPRRRWWRPVLAVAVCVLVLLVVAVELLGRRYLAREVETRLWASGITGEVTVSVGSTWRPVVVPALFGAGLDRLRVQIEGGTVGGLPVRRADYDLRGVDGDVSVLDGTVHVRSIRTGDIRIEVDPAALRAATGTEMHIRNGRLVAGDADTAVDVRVRGDALVLGGDAVALWGAPIEIPIVDDWLLPCTPRVRLTDRTMVLSCRGRKVPGVLVSPLGGERGPTAPGGELVPPQSTVLGGTGGGTDEGPASPDGASTTTTGVPATVDAATTVPPAAPPVTVPAETVPPGPVPPAAVPETVPAPPAG